MVKDKALLVTSRGENLFSSAFPYYRYKVIPMIWDVWPGYWEILILICVYFGVRLFLLLSVKWRKNMTADLGIKTFWIPEGINIKKIIVQAMICLCGLLMFYELGRQKQEYNQILEKCSTNGRSEKFGS